jgi:hypothetical protein
MRRLSHEAVKNLTFILKPAVSADQHRRRNSRLADLQVVKEEQSRDLDFARAISWVDQVAARERESDMRETHERGSMVLKELRRKQ